MSLQPSPGFSGHPTLSSPAVKVWGDSGRATLVGGLQQGGLGQSWPLPAPRTSGTPALASAPARETHTPWKKHQARTPNLLIRLLAHWSSASFTKNDPKGN